MFIRLWLYQKSLKIKSSWFEQTKRIRSKINSKIKFVGQLKNADGMNADGADVYLTNSRKKIKKRN